LIFRPSYAYYGCVESEQGIFEQVMRGDLDFDSDPWPVISESAKDLVRKMLVRDPRRRMTAHQVLCNICFY
jgi:calcium-dependent protein kinase